MTSPRILLNTGRIRAKKQLGQNFLRHPAMAKKIATVAQIKSTDTVLEIGAGLGALTIPVAKLAASVYAVETDSRLTGLLRTELQMTGIENVQIIEENFLKLDIDKLTHEAQKRLLAIGNLPYHISSQVLIRLIAARERFERAVLMFQRELADRLLASRGTKAYGRITVMLNYCADVQRLIDVPAESFFPQPSIDSTVLEIKFKGSSDPASGGEAFLFQVVKAAFSQRRKTLRNALSGGFPNLNPQTAADALTAAGIDPIRRAETLSVAEFEALSKKLREVVQ